MGDTTLLVRQTCRSFLRALDRGRLLMLPGRRLRELARRRPWLGVSILLKLAEELSQGLAAAGEALVERVREPADTRRLQPSLLGFLTRWKS